MSASTRAYNADGKPTIAGKVEAQLRHDILHGVLAPGMKLNLDKLREAMNVGLSPMREAVTRLVCDGWVEVSTQRGYSVTPMSVENLDEVCALRLQLEPYALRLSIANGELDWETNVMGALYRLNKTQRIPEKVESIDAWETANNAFHFALIERCDMPLLIKMHASLVSMNNRYRNIYLSGHKMQRDVIDEHTRIANLAVDRKVEAATKLLCAHITRSTKNLRRIIIKTNS